MKKTFLKTIYVAGAIVLTLVAPSCDTKELTDLNKNPNAIETNIPEYSFTALVLGSGPGSNYRALAQGMQYFASYKEVPATGDKFYNFGSTGGDFGVYTGQWNRVVNLVAMIPGPENVNKRAGSEILRILDFHQATDGLGDMPYTEALKGDANLKPKYDSQQSIYMAMLNGLDAALKSMDATKPNVFGNADPYFKGDITKWKKFGYTLMLRLGMRMSQVDPTNAKLWVEKAVAGGVMTTFADIAYIKYANVTGQMNGRVGTMISGDFAAPGGDNVEGSKWTTKFIDHLKNTQDPRLPVISVVWVPSGNTFTANNTPATQRGMMQGAVNTRPSDFDTYSEPSLLYLDRGAPIITLGPAEAYLILAEAAARGWNVGTTAQSAYENGVRQGMRQWALWPSVGAHSGVITTAQEDAYIAANPYPAAGTLAQQFEVIATQHWVSLLGDDYEVWANWRRIKYPVFNYANWTNGAGQKVSYPGNVTAGKMFRRFSYPISERNVNNINYMDAIKRQGFSEQTIDLLQGRMWWDVGPGTGQSNVN